MIFFGSKFILKSDCDKDSNFSFNIGSKSLAEFLLSIYFSILIIESNPMFLHISTAFVLHGDIIAALGPINSFLILTSESKFAFPNNHSSFFISSFEIV